MKDGAAIGVAYLTLLMVVAGMGIPLMATLNAGLGQRIGHPVAASAILFAVALALTLAATLLVGPPARAAFAGVPWYLFAGGALTVFYILSITYSAPRLGVGNAVFLVLLGQLVAAAAIDHWGLLGAAVNPLTLRRAVGLAVMAAGVWLARSVR